MGTKLLISIALASAAFGQSNTFLHKADMASTYQAVLKEVKKDGFSIESASPDAGIKTELLITGGYKQTGSSLDIEFSSEGAQIIVTVKAIEQKRYKALKTEAWGSPKVNEQKSAAQASKIKGGLGWQ